MDLINIMRPQGSYDNQGINIRYKRAIARLGSNVFCPDNQYPVFPFFSPERDILFLRLVFDIKCHLIHNALMELNRHRRYRHYLRYGDITAYINIVHNMSPYIVQYDDNWQVCHQIYSIRYITCYYYFILMFILSLI